MDWSQLLDILARYGAALGLSALIGLERERKNRPAGLRTMILIGLGSAGFVTMGQAAIRGALADSHAAVPGADISRVLQGLIGGIGFLGAGAVLQNKKAVRGLTTAAAVWVTAAIGTACGLALYVQAAVLAGFSLFTLVVLEYIEEKYFPDQFNEERRPEPNVIQVIVDREGRPVHTEQRG
jgi:putative Mg2+ transporter-C (MgtC) family protein